MKSEKIGEEYLFSNDGAEWEKGVLDECILLNDRPELNLYLANGKIFKYCAHTRKEKEMSKTINYKGKTYEIGKYYLFGDSKSHMYSYLKLNEINLDNDDGFHFKGGNLHWAYIKELPSSDNFGTITDTPIELIDGMAYMFICQGATIEQGIYYKGTMTNHMGSFAINHCTNIRKMVVEK